jgi:hypothetical protein
MPWRGYGKDWHAEDQKQLVGGILTMKKRLLSGFFF